MPRDTTHDTDRLLDNLQAALEAAPDEDRQRIKRALGLGPSRRDMLAAAGALGTGALLGGGGAYTAASGADAQTTGGGSLGSLSELRGVDGQPIALPDGITAAEVQTTGKKIWAYGANGNFVETFTPGEYATDDAAIQAAIDALPSGSQPAEEAHGRIALSQGEYQIENPVVVKGGVWITGMGWDHIPETSTDQTAPGTRLKSNGNSVFVPPDNSSEKIPGIRFSGLTLAGPGPTASGGKAWDSLGGSNQWDLIWIDYCFARDFSVIVDFTDIDSPFISNCHFYRAHGQLIYSPNKETIMNNCTFYDADRGGNGVASIFTGGRVVNCQIQGPAHDLLNLDGRGIAIGCLLGPENPIDRRAINAPKVAICCKFDGDPAEFHIAGMYADEVTLAFNWFASDAANEDIKVRAESSDSHIIPLNTTTSVLDNGVRTRWNGIIGGGPLGGVDLSTTTGQYEGDRAVANGTSAAPTGAFARWTGSEWQYHEPTGTV